MAMNLFWIQIFHERQQMNLQDGTTQHSKTDGLSPESENDRPKSPSYSETRPSGSDYNPIHDIDLIMEKAKNLYSKITTSAAMVRNAVPCVAENDVLGPVVYSLCVNLIKLDLRVKELEDGVSEKGVGVVRVQSKSS